MKKELIVLIVIMALCLMVGGIDCEDKAKVFIGGCKQACYQALNEGQDLSEGPCLLDPMPQDSNWVCDIVHSPRQTVDNERQNQCNS